MNPNHIINERDSMRLLFPTIEDAVDFIKGQSANTQWQAQWTFSIAPTGDGVASTDQPLNIKL